MARRLTSGNRLDRTAAILTAAPITIAAWVYPENVTDVMYVISLHKAAAASADHFVLQFGGAFAGDPVRAQCNGAGAGVVAAATTTGYSANAWHHGCAVFASATDRRAFLDGGGKGTNTTSRTPTGIDSTAVGALDIGTTGAMTGRVAELGIWNVALTDAEVAALARGISPLHIRRANLVTYNDILGLASPEPDFSGQGAHLTVSGTPTQAAHAPVMFPRFRLGGAGWEGAFTAAGGGGGGSILLPRLMAEGLYVGTAA